MSTDVMTDASSRKLSCKRQEARAEAVLGREAVLDARKLVGRLSWAPGGQSGGRLGRQEARREGQYRKNTGFPSSGVPKVP